MLDIDDKGRLNLSRREALIEVEGLTPENDIAPRKPSGPRNGYRGRRNNHGDHND